jgi:hypothetical protein
MKSKKNTSGICAIPVMQSGIGGNVLNLISVAYVTGWQGCSLDYKGILMECEI